MSQITSTVDLQSSVLPTELKFDPIEPKCDLLILYRDPHSSRTDPVKLKIDPVALKSDPIKFSDIPTQ